MVKKPTEASLYKKACEDLENAKNPRDRRNARKRVERHRRKIQHYH